MEPADVISPAFWNDPAPVAAGGGGFPDIPEIRHHVLFETSGSSGAPKWIALSKQALRISAAAVNRHLAVTAADCWGLALPLRHVGGFGVAVRASEAGCRHEHFTPRWDAAEFSRWLAQKQVTLTSLVPTQVHDLVISQLRAPSSLRAMVVGGGRLDETTGRAARGLGWPVLASYGMTEAASQIATQTLDSLHAIYQPAPIPLLPLWRVELETDGHLRIAGPALFSGMLVKHGASWSFVSRTDEWHRTDDHAELADGMLTPLGRTDSRVKVLGELVDVAEIELRLVELSGGRLAPESFIVAPVPDQRAEHLLVPVFDFAVDRAAAEEALAAQAATAAGPWHLRGPFFLENFPRSALGKPLRRKIESIARSQARS